MFGTYEITSVPNMQITVASSVPKSIFEDNFLPFMLEDDTGYLRIEDPAARFLLEDGLESEGSTSGDALIAENHLQKRLLKKDLFVQNAIQRYSISQEKL